MSNAHYFLAIDVDASVTKVVLYNDEFQRISEAQDEITTYYPRSFFFEQDPNQWWLNVRRAIREVVAKIDPSKVVGIGTCAQMHAPIFVDKKGSALHHCLSWPDLRTVEITKEINNAVGVFQPFYTATAPKILWMKRNHPEVMKKTYKILLPKDFITMKLSNVFCTDLNDAIGTSMFDEKKGRWASEVVKYIGIDRDLLPKPRASEDIVGGITRRVAEETGLKEGTPVIAGSADNIGRSLDRNMASAGDLLLYLGTGASVEFISESGARPKGTLRSILGVAGIAPQWFKNNFYIDEVIRTKEKGASAYDLLDSDAKEVGPGADGLIFIPHMMGERAFEGRTRSEPDNFNPYARGVFYGINLGHTRKHFYRAVLEGAAYQLYLCWERIQSLNEDILASRIIVSGGGSKSPVWRQIIADLFDEQVWMRSELETGTLAVACLISVSTGAYPDFMDAVKRISNPLINPIEPIEENHPKYLDTYRLYKKLEEDLKGLFTSSQV